MVLVLTNLGNMIKYYGIYLSFFFNIVFNIISVIDISKNIDFVVFQVMESKARYYKVVENEAKSV